MKQLTVKTDIKIVQVKTISQRFKKKKGYGSFLSFYLWACGVKFRGCYGKPHMPTNNNV
jgi:hypothetical protein